MAAVLKTVVQKCTVGSNPTVSANYLAYGLCIEVNRIKFYEFLDVK